MNRFRMLADTLARLQVVADKTTANLAPHVISRIDKMGVNAKMDLYKQLTKGASLAQARCPRSKYLKKLEGDRFI